MRGHVQPAEQPELWVGQGEAEGRADVFVETKFNLENTNDDNNNDFSFGGGESREVFSFGDGAEAAETLLDAHTFSLDWQGNIYTVDTITHPAHVLHYQAYRGHPQQEGVLPGAVHVPLCPAL